MAKAKKAAISIHRASLDALGGEAVLDKAIADYQEALREHAKTVDVPAPTAHEWVEQIVRQSGGKYAIIEPPVEPSEPEVIKTLEELKAEAFEELKRYRMRAINKGRVTLHGASFAAGLDALTSLIAADMEANASDGTWWRARWRVGAGSYVLVDRNDVRTLIADIRKQHQEAFNNEFQLSEAILKAETPKALAKIDLASGWGE